MAPTSPRFPTVGSIAKRLDVPVSKVEYIIRSRTIRPQGMAGNARVFSESDVQLIASEIQRINGLKEGYDGP